MTHRSVSVVVPVFNRLSLLAPVLDAFATQATTTPFEVIVVDDGSDPPAAGIAAGRDDRFRMLAQPNRGRASAINAGLRAARGQVVVVCDADIVPTAGFIDEHEAFHRDHPAVEATHLGHVAWGLEPSAFAALLGPRANPRMAGLEGPVPWTLWYTDNWSFKRELVDVGIVRFDEAFHTWGWEDLELAHRLAARGVLNHATPAAVGRHLQAPSLDSLLAKFAGSVSNLLHLAARVGRNEHVDGWLALRSATPQAVRAGEAILRRTVAHLESIGPATHRLDPSLRRVLGTSLSDAVFRCGIQRGFLSPPAVAAGASDEEAMRAAMLPHADLVRIAIAALLAAAAPAAAGDLLAFSRRTVVDGGGDDRLVEQFIRRVLPGRPARLPGA